MSLLRRLHKSRCCSNRQASGIASAISASPTRTCIQASSVPPARGTWRSSHSNPNHKASQKTAPATPVGGRRRHHGLRARGVPPDSDSSVLGIASILLRAFQPFLPHPLALLLASH